MLQSFFGRDEQKGKNTEHVKDHLCELSWPGKQPKQVMFAGSGYPLRIRDAKRLLQTHSKLQVIQRQRRQIINNPNRVKVEQKLFSRRERPLEPSIAFK